MSERPKVVSNQMFFQEIKGVYNISSEIKKQNKIRKHLRNNVIPQQPQQEPKVEKSLSQRLVVLSFDI